MFFLGGDTMDEKILVILIIALVIIPIIFGIICLIRNERNGEKDFVDEVGVDLGSLAVLVYVIMLLAIVKLVAK